MVVKFGLFGLVQRKELSFLRGILYHKLSIALLRVLPFTLMTVLQWFVKFAQS